MKFYGRLAIAIVALILLLLWLKDSSENAPTTAATNTAPTTNAAAGSAPAAAKPATVATPAATVVTASTVQSAYARPPTYAAPRVSQACQALAEAARRSRATVIQCADQAGQTVVTVWGYDRNKLNDFLDEAMKAGIRDVQADQPSQSVVQGRVRYQNTFRFRF